MAIFYVSPTGNDSQSGLDASSAFATLQRAQEAMRQSGGADTAYIANGTYFLNSPITLTSADSGSGFVAAPGAAPVISGGAPVSGWTQGANGIWTARVNSGEVLQLTVNGVQQTESRFPNVDPNDPIRGGWLWGQDLPGGNDPQTSLAFKPSDFPAGHAPQPGQQVTVFSENGYANDRLTIASVDGNVIHFTSEANYDLGPASRFYVSEATPDNAGEWSFNAATKTISFRAPAGFDGTGAVASGDQSLFVVDGARDVSIQGLTLTNTAAHDGDLARAAVEAHNATGLVVDANHFVNVGAGVVLHGSTSGSLIQGNNFEHVWASSIGLTSGTSANTITNNAIDHSNEVFVQYGAIDMQESARNTISHNTISNVPRFGISENNHDPANVSGGNTIEYNDIRHSGQQTPDVGAIYLFSHGDPDALGDTIRFNTVIDAGGVNTKPGGFVPGFDMSSGIYLDNLASNAQIYSNFVQGTAHSGILIHGGTDNSIHDNTLLDNAKYGISTIGVDGYEMTGNETFRNFIQVSGDGSNTIDTDQTDPGLIHNNVYYSPTGVAPMVADLSLAQFQARGGDSGSVWSSNAGFVDAANGDYGFAAGSPGAVAGIKTVALHETGSWLAPADAGTGTVEPPIARPPAETPVVVQPVDEAPVTTQPVAETPAVTQPVSETPATTPPVAETPVFVAPETPAVTAPVVDTPVISGSSGWSGKFGGWDGLFSGKQAAMDGLFGKLGAWDGGWRGDNGWSGQRGGESYFHNAAADQSGAGSAYPGQWHW